MKLEDQVCSLELAKKLKELGVKQDGLFTWYEWNGSYIVRFVDWSPEISGQMPYSAFSSAELGEILPNNINERYLTCHTCSRNGWWASYSDGREEHDITVFWGNSEANARAKMLIHLLENQMVKIEHLKC